MLILLFLVCCSAQFHYFQSIEINNQTLINVNLISDSFYIDISSPNIQSLTLTFNGTLVFHQYFLAFPFTCIPGTMCYSSTSNMIINYPPIGRYYGRLNTYKSLLTISLTYVESQFKLITSFPANLTGTDSLYLVKLEPADYSAMTFTGEGKLKMKSNSFPNLIYDFSGNITNSSWLNPKIGYYWMYFSGNHSVILDVVICNNSIGASCKNNSRMCKSELVSHCIYKISNEVNSNQIAKISLNQNLYSLFINSNNSKLYLNGIGDMYGMINSVMLHYIPISTLYIASNNNFTLTPQQQSCYQSCNFKGVCDISLSLCRCSDKLIGPSCTNKKLLLKEFDYFILIPVAISLCISLFFIVVVSYLWITTKCKKTVPSEKYIHKHLAK